MPQTQLHGYSPTFLFFQSVQDDVIVILNENASSLVLHESLFFFHFGKQFKDSGTSCLLNGLGTESKQNSYSAR
jgi:hypothetical protein